jgi:hypothetical protein
LKNKINNDGLFRKMMKKDSEKEIKNDEAKI